MKFSFAKHLLRDENSIFVIICMTLKLRLERFCMYLYIICVCARMEKKKIINLDLKSLNLNWESQNLENVE